MKIFEVVTRKLGGRGIDKKFPYLVMLFKKIYPVFQAEGSVRVKTGYGETMLVSRKDAGLGLTLRSDKEFEPLQTEFSKKVIGKGDVVVDIGANVGYYTKLFGKLTGQKGKVIGFEPEKENYLLLKQNTKDMKNIVIEESALGDEVGEVKIKQDKGNPGESRVSADGDQRVRITTIDQYAKENKLKGVDFVKIDVEGYEPKVLSDGASFLKRQKNLVVIVECNSKALVEAGTSISELIRKIKSLGLIPTQIIDERGGEIAVYSTKELEKRLIRSSYVSIVTEK